MTATGGLTGFVVINSIITITLIIGLVIALFKINVAKYAIPSLKKEYSEKVTGAQGVVRFPHIRTPFFTAPSSTIDIQNGWVNADRVKGVILKYIEAASETTLLSHGQWIIISVIVLLFCLLLWQTIGMASVNNMKCKPLNQDIIQSFSHNTIDEFNDDITNNYFRVEPFWKK